jgi:hypothetical protein
MTSSTDERETIIRIDYAERMVYVWSTQPGWWRRCEDLGMELHRIATGHSEYKAPLCSGAAGVSLASLVTKKTRKKRPGSGFGTKKGVT